MSYVKVQRSSASPFVLSITRQTYVDVFSELSVPDGTWDIVIMRRRGGLRILHTGMRTKPVLLAYEQGDEFICISFKAGTFIPGIAPQAMVDQGVFLPQPNVRSFGLLSERFGIPSFENADDFVGALVQGGLIARDELVDSGLFGEPRAASIRSLQRHFIQSTGVTFNYHRQIQRAHHAVSLLVSGTSAASAALEAGCTDRPHMVKSWKTIMGRTPSQIVVVGPNGTENRTRRTALTLAIFYKA